MYCSVVLFDRPLEALSYKLETEAPAGAIVQVPLGRRSCTGIITAVSSERPDYGGRIRAVLEIVDPKPFITAPLMATLRFMSLYYFVPLGFCLKLAMPGGMMRAGRCAYFAGILPDPSSASAPGSLFDTCPTDPDRALAERLFEALGEHKDGLTETEIRRQFNVSDELFKKWVLDGTLVAHWTLDRARPRETTEAVYSAADMTPARKLGAKQQTVLDWITAQDGPVRHSAVLEKFGSCTPVLHRLEELGLITAHQTARDRTSFDDIAPIIHDVERTDEQNEAIRTVAEHRGFGSFLLFGVTGSGKTEVYLGVMEAVRRRGKGCIFVLPEIALTPQFCAVFRGRFGDDVAVLHSGLSEHERFDTWTRIRNGRIGIAIGPRSALFAPVQNLGLIVIDEEHDSSFKQGETPRYHARDMALFLGQQCACPVILGSATPSLESYARAMQARSTMLRLTQRPMARPMPTIEIIDMRGRIARAAESVKDDETLTDDEKSRAALRARLLSDELISALRDTLARHEQAIVFLNRRGYSTFVQCEYCGHVLYCPNCDVALTYYKYADALRCHYCDYVDHSDGVCPKCGRRELTYTGCGTEQLVEMIQEVIPSARIDRLDRDRTSTRTLQSVLGSFRSGETDILVGTQMIAKGHDIHNVTLVGIVNADTGINMPDFRASERTYQLLTQVSGRAGRGSRPGRVIVQTLRPDHPAVSGVVERDYASFANQELEIRRALSNPPFVSMALLRFEGPQALDTENYAVAMARTARAIIPNRGGACILGPAPAPIPMLCGKFRFQLYLKHPNRSILHQWTAELLHRTDEMRRKNDQIKCIVDIDPYDMM